MVTGATGFVGRTLCARLIEESCKVRVMLRSASKVEQLPILSQAEVAVGNMHDETSLVEACAGVDTVVHLAGVAHVSSANDEVANSNSVGTESLLRAALKQKVRRFVFLSSSLASAAQENSGDITPYGKAKRRSELLLLETAEKNPIEVLILRSVNVYGVGMKGNIASMISMIHRGRLPPLPALRSKISLLGVDDLATAIILATNSSQASKIYTVTDGQDYPVAAIEEAIYRVLGKRLPRWKTPAVILYAASVLAGFVARSRGRETGISGRTYRNLTTDNMHKNEEIRRELGFQPSQNLYQVLPEIVSHIVSQKASPD